MRKRTTSAGRGPLAKPKELEGLIMPVRQAFDSITDGGGMSPEECLSIQLFSALCKHVAGVKGNQKAVLEADRLSANLARMLDERAIDEEVLEQMKVDFFNLTLSLRSVPAAVIWRSLETFTKEETCPR